MAVEADQLNATLSALADPTRRAILARLAEGEATVGEVAEPFAMSLQAVSKHLKVLEHAGLVTQGRAAQRRPCRLRAEPMGQVSAWLEHYRRFWDQSFDRLDEHLRTIQAANDPGHAGSDPGQERSGRSQA
jgi:DNA-binding transcriptional ArsR family regulator